MIDVNIYKEKEEGWEFLLSKSVGIKYEEYKKIIL